MMISSSPDINLGYIFDALETGIILYDPLFTPGSDHEPNDFVISYCNKIIDEMTGVSHGVMKGQRVLSLPNVDNEGRRNIFEQILKVYKTGQHSVNTFYNPIVARHFQQSRTKLGNTILTEVKDITTEMQERRERERQTAFTYQVFDQSINGWFTCDAVRDEKGAITDLLITSVNSAFTKLLGMSEEAVVRKRFLSVFPTSKHNGTFEMNCRVLQSGTTEQKLLRYVGDGLDAWYDVVVSKLEPDALLITFADISILGKAPYGVMHYRAVYDDQRIPVDFVHRVFNQATLDLFNFSFEEVSTKTVQELCILRKNMTLFNTAIEVMKSQKAQRFEYFIQTTNKWIDFGIVPYDDGVLMNFTDITARVIQEQKVQEAADQFFRIVDASLNAIYVWKAVRDNRGAIVDFKYTLVNKTYERMNGRTGAEVIDKTALQLYPGLKGTELFRRYARVVETGEPAQFEDHYKDEDLDIWFEASAVKIGEDEVFISYRDISQQKQAALRLRDQNTLLDSILSASPSGIVVVRMIRDENGTIVDGQAILMNEAAERYTQYPREIMLNKTSRQMEPHILESPVYQEVLKTMETGAPFHMEYQMEMTGRWVDMNVARIDKDHLVNVFTDITESKQYHLEQERMMYELKRSNEALEEFARAASHDLKEPIRKVQYFVNRLKADLTGSISQAQLDLFTRVEKAADRMGTLVEDLLEYSHLDANPQEKEPVNLNEKMRNVLYDLELLMREKKATIQVGELPTISGHRMQLQQLFQNLLTNALIYSRPGVEPQIQVKAAITTGRNSGFHLPPGAAEKQFHIIEISDNGIGFDAEHAEKIFDVFTRLHGNKEYPGTGIGLSIVKKVAENHGGYVMAKGGRNVGARFFILFPV